MQAKKISVTTKNQWFQRAEVIQRNRKKRWQHRQFLVEGVRAINQLRRFTHWQVEALIYSPAERLSGWACCRRFLAPIILNLRLNCWPS